MLLDALIIVGVFAVIFLLIGGDSERKRMQKRIERLQNRKSASPKAMQDSLRRKTAETKGLIYWLMKPLPDFKRLGDRLERIGKDISPKQYAFRRLLMLFIIAFFCLRRDPQIHSPWIGFGRRFRRLVSTQAVTMENRQAG